MKKINLMIAAGLLCAASVQAQTTIASVGFEPGDATYTTKYAYTPGGTYGNWVNKQDGDEWNEQNDGDSHSGDYSFLMNNSDAFTGNTWDRGFVIGNLSLKNNTSYRVSFWVKADETYYDSNTGNEPLRHVKSSMSVGREYCDMPISTGESGLQYLYNFTGFTGEWKHISYMTYFSSKEDQDKWSLNYTGKTDANGEIAWPWDPPLPEDYFVTINMYNPGEYLLDDIKIEEGVTFNEATFGEEGIRLDFGYPTNIADLANETIDKVVSLPASCVSVTVNGTAVPAEYVEGKADGYLYIFFKEGVTLKATDDVKVSFTPAADCPIYYNNEKRPSADATAELQVFGFANETAYFDESVDEVLPSVWDEPRLVSSNPENESFNLDAATFKNVALTYDRELNLESATANLSYSDNFGNHEEDLTSKMSLSDDKKTLNIAVSGLADGEYTLTITDLENAFRVKTTEPQEIIFAIGEDKGDAVSEIVYASDFDNEMTGGVPQGWLTKSEDEVDGNIVLNIHEYAFNEDGSQKNYNWGGNPGGGGARLYEGFSGDFKKALYWCSRSTGLGYASYGELVADYIDPAGELDEDAPEGIALRLEPRKYQISFTMAAWKSQPVFRFTLEDLEGNVYAKFDNYTATPNMNGTQAAVSGALKCTTDFTVDKEGYYVLKFASQDQSWQEFLLGNVKLITMPSKAAYWNGELKKVIEEVEPTYTEVKGDDLYDGDTKTAFAAAIEKAKAGGFTSGTQIQTMIEQLQELNTKMIARRDNIDNYEVAIHEAQSAIEVLDGKYLDAPLVKEAQAIIDKYSAIKSSTLSDEELAEVAPALTSAVNKVKNAKNAIDYLSYGVYKAAQTAEKFGVDPADGYNATTDDRDLAADYNAKATIELYKKIAANEDLSEMMDKLYDTNTVDDNFELGDPNYDEEGHPLMAQGVNFTGLVQNPNFYTTGTDANVVDFTGWTFEALSKTNEETGEVTTGSAKMTAAASDENPVNVASLNAYGSSAEYKFYQTIENLPVGVYTIYIGSRTAQKNQSYGTDEDGKALYGVFNAQNDETGIWDKYVFAQVDDETPVMVPFAIGDKTGQGFPTLIADITIKEGQKLTIGAVENYTSGKASGHNFDAETGEYEATPNGWDTNTYVRDVQIYFTSGIEGYDYAAAAGTLETAIETVEAPATKATGIYNLAGQKVDAAYKGIVIKNGRKMLQK